MISPETVIEVVSSIVSLEDWIKPWKNIVKNLGSWAEFRSGDLSKKKQ
jgi:hypothetical protein